MTDTLCRHCLSYAMTKCLEIVSFREKVFIGLTVVCVWGCYNSSGEGMLGGQIFKMAGWSHCHTQNH